VSETREPLKRDIGFLGSAFLSFNGLVGAAIFVLPGTLHDRFGSFSPLLFPIFGLLALAIVLPFARVAGHFGQTGGPVVYAARFGPFAAFQAGWIYYVARAAAFAANLNVLCAYLAALAPSLGNPAARAGIIVASSLFIATVNIVGVKRAVRLLDLLTLLKAAPLLLFALAGLALFGFPALPASAPPEGELGAAALLILYAFVGFENSSVATGETADPRRTVPRALVTTVIAAALLYTLIQAAYAAAMTPGEGGDAPMVAFGSRLLGPVGGLVLTAAAIASLAGNISGGVTATARTSYAMARDGLLPGWFGAVSRRWATPVPSILVLTTLVALLAITGSFVLLAVVSTLARMFVYALSIAALPGLERGRPILWLPVAAAIGLCGWAAAQSSWDAWRVLLILAGSGLALFALTGPHTTTARE
jgi:amino acid transporter